MKHTSQQKLLYLGSEGTGIGLEFISAMTHLLMLVSFVLLITQTSTVCGDISPCVIILRHLHDLHISGKSTLYILYLPSIQVVSAQGRGGGVGRKEKRIGTTNSSGPRIAGSPGGRVVVYYMGRSLVPCRPEGILGHHVRLHCPPLISKRHCRKVLKMCTN